MKKVLMAVVVLALGALASGTAAQAGTTIGQTGAPDSSTYRAIRSIPCNGPLVSYPVNIPVQAGDVLGVFVFNRLDGRPV